MKYWDAIEKLTVYFSGEKYQDEVITAKREFFGDVGIDDKESDRYEQWMNLFFDWYLFSRPLSGSDLPPAQFAMEIDTFQQLHPEEKKIFQQLAKSEYSLLQFIKAKKEWVIFKDLFRRRKVKVHFEEFVVTMEKGNICDARLIPDEDHFRFTRGF
ncbi:MAG: hypothetical protein KDD33_03765, partial [Bdellovibrionales bacterium]|nr:hypothetical protein [Bdellovibrionales bacterium]